MDSVAQGEIDIDRFAGAQLRALRLKQGMSLKDLGDCLGVTYQQVRKYELGENRMSISTAHRLAQALNIDVRYFFPDDANAQQDRLRNALSHDPNIQLAAAQLAELSPASRAAVLTVIADLSSRPS